MKSTVTIVIGNSPADKFLIRGQAQTGGTTPKNFPQHLLNQAESNPANSLPMEFSPVSTSGVTTMAITMTKTPHRELVSVVP